MNLAWCPINGAASLCLPRKLRVWLILSLASEQFGLWKKKNFLCRVLTAKFFSFCHYSWESRSSRRTHYTYTDRYSKAHKQWLCFAFLRVAWPTRTRWVLGSPQLCNHETQQQRHGRRENFADYVTLGLIVFWGSHRLASQIGMWTALPSIFTLCDRLDVNQRTSQRVFSLRRSVVCLISGFWARGTNRETAETEKSIRILESGLWLRQGQNLSKFALHNKRKVWKPSEKSILRGLSVELTLLRHLLGGFVSSDFIKSPFRVNLTSFR